MIGKGLWDWGKKQVASLASFTKSKVKSLLPQKVINAGSIAASVLKETYHTVWAGLDTYFSLPSVRNYLRVVGQQLWEGAGRPLDPATGSHIFFNKNAHMSFAIYMRQMFVHGTQLTFILAQGMTLGAMMQRLEDRDNVFEYATFYTLFSLNCMASGLLYDLDAHKIYQAILGNMGLIQAVALEKPEVNKTLPFQSDDITAGLIAGLENSEEHYFYLAIACLIGCLPYGEWPAKLIRSYINGRSMTALKCTAVNMSAENTKKLLQQLNPHHFGLGVSFEASCEAVCYLLQYLTGVPADMTRYRVQAMLYPYFATAMLMREKPLPTYEHGWDLVRWPRAVMRFIRDDLIQWAIEYYQRKPEDKNNQPPEPEIKTEAEKEQEFASKKKVEDFARRVNKDKEIIFAHIDQFRKYLQQAREEKSGVVNYLSKTFLFDWDDFKVGKDLTLFFDVYYAQAKTLLENILKKREQSLIKAVMDEGFIVAAKDFAARRIASFPVEFTKMIRMSPQYRFTVDSYVKVITEPPKAKEEAEKSAKVAPKKLVKDADKVAPKKLEKDANADIKSAQKVVTTKKDDENKEDIHSEKELTKEEEVQALSDIFSLKSTLAILIKIRELQITEKGKRLKNTHGDEKALAAVPAAAKEIDYNPQAEKLLVDKEKRLLSDVDAHIVQPAVSTTPVTPAQIAGDQTQTSSPQVKTDAQLSTSSTAVEKNKSSSGSQQREINPQKSNVVVHPAAKTLVIEDDYPLPVNDVLLAALGSIDADYDPNKSREGANGADLTVSGDGAGGAIIEPSQPREFDETLPPDPPSQILSTSNGHGAEASHDVTNSISGSAGLSDLSVFAHAHTVSPTASMIAGIATPEGEQPVAQIKSSASTLLRQSG